MTTALLLSPLTLTVAGDRWSPLLRPCFHIFGISQHCYREPAASVGVDFSRHCIHRRRLQAPPTHCSASQAAASGQDDDGGFGSEEPPTKVGFWSKWKADTAAMRSKLAKLGLAAVLAYGLFDGITYTTFFVLAFLGYEKSTGKNPAANLQALLGIVILMWTGNNVTRPFRVAGAAALAPAVDEGLKRIQKHLRLRSQVYAFAFVVGVVAATCLSIVGVLILSRWGK